MSTATHPGVLRTRRDVLRHGAGLAVAGLGSSFAGAAFAARPAAEWPDHVIRVVVPYAAGQGADVLTRLLAEQLAKSLNQAVIVENRGGAGGNIGAGVAAKSAADGYTFMLGTNATNAANEFLYPSLGYNPGTDFDGVAMIGALPMVICSSAPELPTNGIAELIARARNHPDTLNVGLPSTTASVVFAQFVKAAQAPLFGVKYKASAQSMTDVIGGQIPLVIDTVTAARPHVQGGRLKALGITSLKASEMLPGVRPVAEQGVPGFDVVAWDALFSPHGTPVEVVQKMSNEIERVLRRPEIRTRLMDIGVEPVVMGANQLDSFVKDERRKWGAVIKASDIHAE